MCVFSVAVFIKREVTVIITLKTKDKIDMKKIIIAMILLATITAFPAFAGSTYYFKGDQVFSLRAGVNQPAFFSFYNDPEKGTLTFGNTHLKLGGYASIAYQIYLAERFAIGGELAYVFNSSNSKDLLTTVPITAKLTFVPVQTGKLDIAMSLNLGGAFIRYNAGKYFAPYASLTLTPSIFFTENWGLGIESGIMFTGEIYTPKNSKYKSSAFAGLIPITLALSYRH